MAQPPTFSARPHQRAAIDFVKTHPFCGVFLDVGLGKTATVLEALYELDEPTHVLVVAPKAIAVNTWPAEVAKWRFPWEIDRLVFDERGRILPRSEREATYDACLTSRPAIHVTTQDHVSALVEHMKKRGAWPFGTVVIDEMQAFKGHSSKRFKALLAARKSGFIHRLIGLTGTPCPNGLCDLWAEICLMDLGWRLGPTYGAYMDAFFLPTRTVPTQWGGQIPTGYVPRHGAEPEIWRRLADVTVSMSNEDLDLPERIVVDVELTMGEREAKLYDELAKKSVLELADETEDGLVIEAANAAVLSAKLRQLASGTLYTNRGPYGTKLDETKSADEHVTLHRLKLGATQHICDDASGPVLVAYDFHADELALLTHFDGKKHAGEPFRRRLATSFDGTPEMVAAWNRGEIELMLIQPRSAGYGLNLQEGGHTLVWYSLPWSLESYMQTNGRLHRQGQTSTVTVHRLLVRGTIDSKVARALAEKDRTQSDFLSAVAMGDATTSLEDALAATVSAIAGAPVTIEETPLKGDEGDGGPDPIDL